MTELAVSLGPLTLRSPLVAASGTVGSVVDFAAVGALEAYGAAVAKSVSGIPWPGNPAPRLASTGPGMLNAIGIQNPGVAAWVEEIGPRLPDLPVPVWGSAVGTTVEEFVGPAPAVSRDRVGVVAEAQEVDAGGRAVIDHGVGGAASLLLDRNTQTGGRRRGRAAPESVPKPSSGVERYGRFASCRAPTA